MNAVDPTDEATTELPWILAVPWRRAFVVFLFTIVPIVSFAGSDGFLAPDWQDPSAEWSSVFASDARNPLEIALLVLFGLGTAMIAWRPALRTQALGRAMLAGAVVLSGFYAVALSMATGGATIVMTISFGVLAGFATVVVVGFGMLNDWTNDRKIGLPTRLGVAVAVAALVTIVQPLQEFLLAIVGWAVLSILGAGPFLCLAVSGRLLLTPLQDGHARRLVPSIASVAAGITSTYVTWQRAMDHYATLSPTDPFADCYVASAAASGHTRLVGAWNAPVGPSSVRVTPQLVRLKSVELLVRAASPRLHRAVRRAYDRLGPRLARYVTTPVRGDLAWLSLLPLDLLARLVLRACPRPARVRATRLLDRAGPAPGDR